MAGCFEIAAGGMAGRNGARSCAVSGGGTGAVAIVRVCGGFERELGCASWESSGVMVAAMPRPVVAITRSRS